MYIELFGNQTIPSIRPSSISTQKFTMPSMSRFIKLQAVSKTHFHFKTKLLFSREQLRAKLFSQANQMHAHFAMGWKGESQIKLDIEHLMYKPLVRFHTFHMDPKRLGTEVGMVQELHPAEIP